MMGGRISVESTLDHGSAFTVDLPFPVAQAADASARTPRPAAATPSSHFSRPGARVLLAEDSAVNQQVAVELLALAGVVVDVAGDGRSAVEAAAARVYDLILMDVQMPVLDGLEATRQIRRLPGREHTPIVAMTANAFEDDRQACLDAGMDDHLAKPVDPERLYAALGRWVSERAAGDAVAAAAPREDDSPALDEVMAALRRLPGVDTGPWLDGGTTARRSYLQLLGRFAASHAEDARTVRTRLAADQPAKASRTARTLQRVAGGLGLTEVERCASELEAAIAAGDALPALEPRLADLEERLGHLLAGFADAGVEAVPDVEPSSP